MHLEQGFTVGRPDLRPDFITPIEITNGRLLVATRYFALERFDVARGAVREQQGARSPQVVTVLSGDLIVANGRTEEALAAGHSVVIWPNTEGSLSLTAQTDAVALRSWVPDLVADIVVPARQAGASDKAIADLGSPLDDVTTVLGS
jgi:quercetin dioxygenase-like cupin family protein